VHRSRIDAHQHFWRLARGDYGWLVPSLAPIYRDFGPDDLAPLLAGNGIERTVLVQAAPTEAETAFLLRLAAQTPFVAGVVGWTDFDAPDAPERIAALAGDPLLVGLRPMVQDIADDGWLSRSVLAPAFGAMAELGLVLDALVLPRHLPHLARVVDRHPELSVVVDHAAKPRIRDGVLDPWRSDIAIVAASPHVSCKLSGLVTEAGDGWTTERLRPYVDHLLATFGARRLLWGSDWPVVELAGGYAAWRSASLALIDGLDEADRDAVLGGNAEAVYLSTREGRRA
jgi:L-fuconolactonase